MNLQLRREFQKRRLKGTIVAFHDRGQGALERKAEEFLEITYPSADVIDLLRATRPGQSRPVVLIGERGIGKSHLMAFLYHALKNPELTRNWLDQWSKRLQKPELQTIPIRSGLKVVAESLHRQNYKTLWDLLFHHHPRGEYYRGKWEARDTPVPSAELVQQMLQETPMALILDEFQTWYESLPQTKRAPYQSWAFNFIQILSEIAQQFPEHLLLVVSVRSSHSEAYQQIHRVNPFLIDFKSLQAKKDRPRLLLHRLFQNRLQIPSAEIHKQIQTHLHEYFRLFQIPEDEQEAKKQEFLDAWPFSPLLLRLLEDHILSSAQAQETRDLIKILAHIFQTVENTPFSLITPADFVFSERNRAVTALLDSIASSESRSLYEVALRNLQAVQEAFPKRPPRHLHQIIAALWLRSLSISRDKGALPQELQLDITKASALDDNQFRDELQQIVENSFNIHERADRLLFQEEENPIAKLRATAKNDKLFTDQQDLRYLAKEIRYLLGGKEELSGRFRTIVLRRNWEKDPWSEVSEEERPESWREDRIPCIVLPQYPTPLNESLGTWLKKHISKGRNTLRFILPKRDQAPLFLRQDLILLTRMTLKAEEWKREQREYAELFKKFRKELHKKIEELFSSFALLRKWDFQNPENCIFDVEPLRAKASQFLLEMETRIQQQLFAPEDFELFLRERAEKNTPLSDVMRELKEPLPQGKECIPYLGEAEFLDKIKYACAEGKIALNIQDTQFLCRESGESVEEAWRRIRKYPLYGRLLEETTLCLPKPQVQSSGAPKTLVPHSGGSPSYPSTPQSSSSQIRESTSPLVDIMSSPSPRTDTSFSKFESIPQPPLQLLETLEKWGIQRDTPLVRVQISLSQIRGRELEELIQSMPDHWRVQLRVEKQNG